MSAVASVKVRMYRQLLGDCFLLTLAGADGTPSFVMIDCGILQGIDGGKERMQAIAEDIREVTGGKIDLLLITHQHYDHISGFSHAREILLDPHRMSYGEVWMGWTENPEDPQAVKLGDAFTRRKLAMADFAAAIERRGADAILDDVTADLQKFIGPVEPAVGGFGAAPQGRLTGDRIMDELRKSAPVTRFLEPGSILATPGSAGLQAAILAPPRAESRLFKDLPTRGESKETYLGEEVLQNSLLVVDPSGEGQMLERVSPFAPRYAENLALDPDGGEPWGHEEDTARRWLHDHYFAELDREELSQAYRRIDDVWAGAASSLALKLDSDTNNTSLVVAFRLPDGKFLLFAADAQVGNWLSWHDQVYPFDDGALSAADILGQTVLYKVGHHGSHNATLKSRGLELMTDPALSAMVSTVEEIAGKQGKPPGWQMPFEAIRDALLMQCRGRLLRGDRRWEEDPDTAPYRDQPGFTSRLDDTNDLYVELEVYSAV